LADDARWRVLAVAEGVRLVPRVPSGAHHRTNTDGQPDSRSRILSFNGEQRMPWNPAYYPASMKRLAPSVRQKAIEIANALLEQGYDEGKAIRVAIAQAKRWASGQSARR
jgi:hypothetical protein